MASILSSADLPHAELQASVLDGELVRVGEGFCAIDAIIDAQLRAASIATEVPGWAIAERRTAAWIYGVVGPQPRQLSLCVTSIGNVRPLSSHRYIFREVVLGANEVRTLAGLNVTTPLRTAIDIVRIDDSFQNEGQEIVRALSHVGNGFTLDDCVHDIEARRNLPHKLKALQRLAIALAGARKGQPALTL
ncbi:MAG: hypothetical protein ABIW32_03850 [Terrimesophilobacter sp.]